MSKEWIKELVDKALEREYTPEAVAWRARVREMFSFVDQKRAVKEATDSSFGLFHVFARHDVVGRYYLPKKGGGSFDLGLDYDFRVHETPADVPGSALWTSEKSAEPFVELLQHFRYKKAHWLLTPKAHRMADWGGSLIYPDESMLPVDLCELARRMICEIIVACDITDMDRAMLERAKLEAASGGAGQIGPSTGSRLRM